MGRMGVDECNVNYVKGVAGMGRGGTRRNEAGQGKEGQVLCPPR